MTTGAMVNILFISYCMLFASEPYGAIEIILPLPQAVLETTRKACRAKFPLELIFS